MEYYRDGFHPGDPAVRPAAHAPREGLPDRADVLIVGSGPAGLVAAAQLAQFPSITTAVIERRPEPMRLGQADGVACRTLEMFQAFGIARQMIDEGAWVTETLFWRPDPEDRARIRRSERVQDVADDLSEMPHIILNQARIHEHLRGAMLASPTRLDVDHGWELVSLTRDDAAEHPVAATVRGADGEERTIRARYVIGGDGARSAVRKAIGRALSGERADHAWGVMDIMPLTDFPDFRFKNAIQSDGHGSLISIPREGGHMVRLYVDLGAVTDETREAIRAMSVDDVLDVARRILHPYTIDSAETVWFSVYEVAQRIADGFDDAVGRDDVDGPRVFIAGDACHTHSAKAGQGMNVSMQDAFNLGWKLAAVLEGRADPALLETYDAERRPIAQELIDFDREWSRMLAAPAADEAHPERGGVSPEELASYFARQGRYTAGVAARYTPGISSLTGDDAHQHLATGLEVGTRFHSAPVVRVGDGRPMQLGHCHTADGRWRAYLFADRDERLLRALCAWLEEDPASPLNRYAPGADVDAVVDVRGVLQRGLHATDASNVPPLLAPVAGRLGLVDHHKAFVPADDDIYDRRGIDRERGAAVIVRPDQYIAQVLPLDATDEIARLFERALLRPAG
ncbi:MAG: FAD-dependent monooxygenase [Microbacterium sp.]